MCIPTRNVCVCYGLWNPPTRQFTQLYCGTPGCQLAENTAFLIARSLIWQPVSIKSEEVVLGEKNSNILNLDYNT